MKTLRNRSILLGRVLPRVQSEIARPTVVMRPTWDVTPRETVVVRVPTLEFDKFFKRYFRHETDLFAHDPQELCQEGDTVLIKKAEVDINEVDFEVSEVIFKLGDVKDPVSGENVVGDMYRKQMAEIAEAYGANPDGFDYEEAPDRGWQEDKRDFSSNITYYKWHEFKQSKKDKYNLIS